MPVLTQGPTLGDLLKYEAPNLYSRDRATVASAQNLALGTVVGRETASGQLKALDPAATDGSEMAAGVLANDIDATLIERDDAIPPLEELLAELSHARACAEAGSLAA